MVSKRTFDQSIFHLMSRSATPTLFLFILLFSCNTQCLNKESFLENFTQFSDDVADHYNQLIGDDWEEVEREYSLYLTKCYPKFKDRLSAAERLEFWKGALGYGLRRASQDESFEFNLSDYGIDVEDEMSSLTDAGKAEIEQFIKEEFGPELENVFDSLIKELEGLSNEFKNWLDNL